jgi:hypothetical protein
MAKFSEEFDQRLRRVCGITDDSLKVWYESDFDAPTFNGCDTCNYGGDEGRSYITVRVEDPNRYIVREFGDMGELMRELDAVAL